MNQRTAEEWKQSGVELGNDVDPRSIAPDAVIYPGSRISGSLSSIGPGSILGEETPVNLVNCQLGRRVRLKGGYFSGSVFFDDANMGSGAHVREGCILEEESNGAHTVGLKQTVFLPFVTAGSLINFCDALMAGGTSRKDHSEIGSSYVHFNFTPHQDKATASLIGDVPNGVFLDRRPVFLGGQGGLVGPARIAFGTVIAAGGVCRKDILDESQLHVPAVPRGTTVPYDTGVYRGIDRIVGNCLIYIGNILALREWYRHVRRAFVRDEYDRAVLNGGLANLNLILTERVNRLGDLATKMELSIAQLESRGGDTRLIEEQKRLVSSWPLMKKHIEDCHVERPSAFIEGMAARAKNHSYVEAVKTLDGNERETGCDWLQSIVNETLACWSFG